MKRDRRANGPLADLLERARSDGAASVDDADRLSFPNAPHAHVLRCLIRQFEFSLTDITVDKEGDHRARVALHHRPSSIESSTRKPAFAAARCTSSCSAMRMPLTMA